MWWIVLKVYSDVKLCVKCLEDEVTGFVDQRRGVRQNVVWALIYLTFYRRYCRSY